MSSHEVCVCISRRKSCSFVEWVRLPFLLLILVTSCHVKMKDCLGGEEFGFLESCLNASCFVGVNFMYDKFLQKGVLKIDLLKCSNIFVVWLISF